MPTGARAGKYSVHISKLCARCGVQEDDVHLFFTCPFSKAAWFSAPWFIRSENLVINCSSLTEIILNFLRMNHPHASLSNILTFMWCIWKSRNDNLFGRKSGEPYQIHHMAQAINQNLEMIDALGVFAMQAQECSKAPHTLTSSMQVHDQQNPPEVRLPAYGETLKSDQIIKGSKIYTDAAWKTRKVPGMANRIATGIGIYCDLQEQNNNATIFIQASTSTTRSVLQAEATALLLATKIVSHLGLQKVTFLTDNSSLAKAAASTCASGPQVFWEIRSHIADYLQVTQSLDAAVFHIKRDFNGVAHNCAHQAIRQSLSSPIFSCSNSAHRNSLCPNISMLQSFPIQGYVIHAVQCL
jgi:ribonuclease HI